ncbi:hypothetical protein PPERSA_06539 [Pseudocohnilembus persalinus]|uniref:Uncharacterized protein n=1 Tax=Pseudocohnilembus persalinus TaxID=266149 RepID=A0A0V0QRK5_PSEPJ|nr:hypothetical protein PPERSA_06539 [Pseudocohnilembus persalinus]|eukprot:KRX04905.1 hypothetical protein PPERSA_06539 [Pseudocohnilembus persalinus]
MGGEMIYIIDQRLKAQNIDQNKQDRVLNDLLKSLFSENFLNQVFQPQKTFSLKFIQQLFEKTVHCSIMKLNEVSMNKLQQLVYMGVKLQLYNSSSPCDIYFQTLNHLNGIMNIAQSGPSQDLLLKCKQMFIQTYKDMGPVDFIQIRAELTRFFSDKQVKVFLFMQEKLQNQDGSIIISNGGVTAPFIEKPGFVKIYNENGEIVKQKSFTLKVANNYQKNDSTSYLGNNYSLWGTNLYETDNKILEQNKKRLKLQSHSQI